MSKNGKAILKVKDTLLTLTIPQLGVSDEQVELLNSMLCATTLRVSRAGHVFTLPTSSERLPDDLQVLGQALRFCGVDYALHM